MSRLTVFLFVVGVFFLSAWIAGGTIGVSSTCENSGCVVSASSSLLSVVLAFGLALFLVFYPQRENTIDKSRVVGVWRRFGAFLLDYSLVLTIVSPLAALPLLIAEASYSGRFQWSFQREFSRPTDSLYLLPAVFAVFIILLYYFYQHLRVSRQTVGQYVLGYRVIKANGIDGKPKYGLRVILSFLGFCMWPVSVILALRNPQKTFWWDSVTNSRVVRVSAANNRMERTGNEYDAKD